MSNRGFTIVELTVVLIALTLLLAVIVPATARVGGESGVAQSMSNLQAMSVAHALYAWDWNGRQVTWARDDLGVYESMLDYNAAHDCFGWEDEGCHPSVLAGYDCEFGVLYAYWSHQTGHAGWAFEPINFPDDDGSSFVTAWGSFRHPNFNPLHNYLNGRYHDPVFYAPNDQIVISSLDECIGTICEFNSEDGCNPGWGSYSMSPAAMFHPDVMRSNTAGGWQDPWSLDYGFESPGFSQALYPDLKTLMIEQHWNQDPPDICNPNAPTGEPYDCEPYMFNHGVDSTPLAVFYDGSVRLFPNAEALAADQQILDQTGQIDGLWHRGTPYEDDGYFISGGFDGAPISHHILTTDGILGRDTLAETSGALAARLSWDPIPVSGPDSRPSANRRTRAAPELILGEAP